MNGYEVLAELKGSFDEGHSGDFHHGTDRR